MGNFDLLMTGFGIAITPMHLMLMVCGVLMGLVVGVLPGLGAPNGVSLLIPLTFTLDPTSAIILLSSMYWGRCSVGRRPRSCSTSPASRVRWPPHSTAIRWRNRGNRPGR